MTEILLEGGRGDNCDDLIMRRDHVMGKSGERGIGPEEQSSAKHISTSERNESLRLADGSAVPIV